MLLGIAVGVFYHTVTVDRNGTVFKSDQQVRRNKSVMSDHNLLLRNPERLASLLETSRTDGFVSFFILLTMRNNYFILTII